MLARVLKVSARRLAVPSARLTGGIAQRQLQSNFVSPLARSTILNTHRFHSTDDSNTASFQVDNPQLMIAFTCKKCDTRSSHTFSRQSYYKGSVLIQCPGCKNRHLIADNLKIFSDDNFNLEEVMKAKGDSVATDTQDLAFEDIPDSLKSTIGHYAKDAPEEYQKKTDESVKGLPDSEPSSKN